MNPSTAPPKRHKHRTSSWDAKRIYLLPGEILESSDACPICAQIAAAIHTEKYTQRRHIPMRVLDAESILSHLENDVLGRRVGFGDPTQLAQLPLSE